MNNTNESLLAILRDCVVVDENHKLDVTTDCFERVAQLYTAAPGAKTQEVRWKKVAELYREAYTPDGHSQPHDCFATGPKTGDPIRDYVVCPGCIAQHAFEEALRSTPLADKAATPGSAEDVIAELFIRASRIDKMAGELSRLTDGMACLANPNSEDRKRFSAPAAQDKEHGDTGRWQTGTPDVKEGKCETFWCRIEEASGDLFHRALDYANRHIMPLADGVEDAPKGIEPVSGSEEDFYWTGWHEKACDQCDTQWMYSGKVVAWMRLPKFAIIP